MKENDKNYLIQTLKKISNKQNYFIDPCLKELGPNYKNYDTIPIMFVCCKSCKTLTVTGIYNDNNNYIEFTTNLFKIIKVKDNYLKAELLQLQSNNIIRTNLLVNIDIDTICGFKCLEAMCIKEGKPISNNGNQIKVTTREYITFSDGVKKIYLDSDGYNDFNKILNPQNYSYANLFINGVLQPTSFYIVEEGKLELLTDSSPLINSTIILQMIEISLNSS